MPAPEEGAVTASLLSWVWFREISIVPTAPVHASRAGDGQRSQKSRGSASASTAEDSSRPAIGRSATHAGSPAAAMRRMTPACRRARCGTTDPNTSRSPSKPYASSSRWNRRDRSPASGPPVPAAADGPGDGDASGTQGSIEKARSHSRDDGPVAEPDQLLAVDDRVVGGRVLMADNQPRPHDATDEPSLARWRAEIGGQVVQSPEPLADLH